MRNEKRVVYNGNTFIIKNIVPNMTDSERKLVIQGISNELSSVFARGR